MDDGITNTWEVNIIDQRCCGSWEISVLKKSNIHGKKSYGWIDQNKILISADIGYKPDSICGFVFKEHVKIANELCRRLNSGQSID
jgi:hypothetical protein